MRQTLTSEQMDLYRKIVDGPRATSKGISPVTDAAGNLVGPFKSFLISPGLGSILEELGRHLRYGSPFDPLDKELAILRVARHMRSQFEWDAHVEVARSMGATEVQISAVSDLTQDPLSIVAKCVDEIMGPRTAKANLAPEFTDVQRMYVIALVGYYELIANLMHEFGA
jgi:4-carboxymuconolactone decarboxylase